MMRGSKIYIFSYFYLVCSVFAATIVATDEYHVVNTDLGQAFHMPNHPLVIYDLRAIDSCAEHKTQKNGLKTAPEPADPWTPNVFDAFEHGNVCYQNGVLIEEIHPQGEDCLFLNVYVPETATPDNKLAVMFWIHGGGFILLSGNENLFGPDFLIEQDVILVTINYRLGVFGFLSLDTPEYSGNMGMKDQQLALKWIHENIGHFNGDNKRITIFGESAGGSSTHYQLLSSESRKYFQNAIVLSGTAENIWTRYSESHHLPLAHKIAKDLNEPQQSHEDLIEFFRTVSAEKIAGYALPLLSLHGFLMSIVPIVERIDAKKPFLYETSTDYSEIEPNVMFYHTASEMLLHPMFGLRISDLKSDDFNCVMAFRGIDPETDKNRQLAQKVREFYFGNAVIDEKQMLQYINFASDVIMAYPAYKSAKLHAKTGKGKTYFVRFSVDSALNMFKRLSNTTSLSGASHADETCYMFRGGICQPYYDEVLENKNSEQSKVSLNTIELMTKLFSNFAKYNDPTNENDLISGYHPLSVDSDVNFLDITNDGLQLGRNPRKFANQFWAELERTATDRSPVEYGAIK